MAVTVYKAGERFASGLIKTGNYDMSAAWSFSAEDGDKLLGSGGKDWANFGKWHLGEDSGEPDDTKAHWKYPFGKDGKVYRRALAAVRSRASQQGATAIFDAAGRLMEAMDKEEEKKQAALDPELVRAKSEDDDPEEQDDDDDDAGEAGDEGDDEGDDDEEQQRALVAELRGLREAMEGVIRREGERQIQLRQAIVRMEHASIDKGARTIDMVASSGAPVRRWDWQRGREYDEVLEISPASIRMQRLNAGAPMLDSHNYWRGTGAMIGAVVPGSARVEGGELRCTGKFSATPEGERCFQMADEGTLRFVSVGYLTHGEPDIDETRSPPVYTFRDWEPYEVSAVAMPADPRAGFRSAAPVPPPSPSTSENSMTAEVTAARDAAVKEERERTQAIRELGTRLAAQGLDQALVEKHVTEGSTVDQFRAAALDALAKPTQTLDQNARNALPGSPAIIGRKKARELTKQQELGRLVRIFLAGGGVPERAERIARSEEWDDGNREWQTRALISGIGASGGFLVPEEYHPEVIELLRNRAVVRRLGAMVLPMPGGNLTMPRLNAGATASYVGEAVAVNASQESFGQFRAAARKLLALVPVSNDLIKFASPQVDQVVLNDMIAQIAVAEDLAFIRGPGTQFQPRGMRNWAVSGNVLTSAGTTLANFITDLQAMESALEAANVRMLNPGIIFNPRSKNAIKLLQTTTGAFVFRDEMAEGTLDGYPFAFTNNIPANLGTGAQTEWYLVDFADAVIAEVPGLEIEISREAAYADSTGTLQAAFSQDVTVMRVIEQHDFGMRHDVSVAVMTAVSY